MNSDIKRVKDEFRGTADLDLTDIGVAVKNGVVPLTGFVRSYRYTTTNRGGHNMKLNALVYTVAVGLLASSMMPIMICHAASDKPATRAETKQGGDKGGDKAMGGAMKLQAENAISQQRKKIIGEAVAALAETKSALRALDAKKTEEALAALERASGKLDIVLARDPRLALAPIDVGVTTYDVYATLDAIKKAKE
jgi:hypothetical protein